ncbi:hypothetical protein [Marinomonas sp. 2405UD68-3]|uniref:hypothetical protein n=1 Tax=Marinomonas sp. 2405UD68-3 TaxID=3391835 RepID=UPI0039C8EBB2
MSLSHVSIIYLATTFSASVLANDSSTEDRTFLYKGKLMTYDQVMLMTAPPEGYEPMNDDADCRERLEVEIGITPEIFSILELSEGGYNGMAKSWPTRSGSVTWDTGKYSINEINWKRVYPTLTPVDLRWNNCASLIAAAMVIQPFYESAKLKLRKDIVNKVPPLEMLEGLAWSLAGYNSKTPEVRERYRDRLLIMLAANLFEGDASTLWKKSMRK